MTNKEIDERLAAINAQGYPLILTERDAIALETCIGRIMEFVPEDDHPFVRADYAGVTSALHHPVGEDGLGQTNVRVPAPDPTTMPQTPPQSTDDPAKAAGPQTVNKPKGKRVQT